MSVGPSLLRVTPVLRNTISIMPRAERVAHLTALLNEIGELCPVMIISPSDDPTVLVRRPSNVSMVLEQAAQANDCVSFHVNVAGPRALFVSERVLAALRHWAETRLRVGTITVEDRSYYGVPDKTDIAERDPFS